MHGKDAAGDELSMLADAEMPRLYPHHVIKHELQVEPPLHAHLSRAQCQAHAATSLPQPRILRTHCSCTPGLQQTTGQMACCGCAAFTQIKGKPDRGASTAKIPIPKSCSLLQRPTETWATPDILSKPRTCADIPP